MPKYDHILLATEGREIPARAVEIAASMANSSVHVISIARVYGVAFGLQTPGLMPTRREWQEQRELVTKAVKALRKRGIEADGHVVGTRKATKTILAEAQAKGCEAIVMPADPPRNRFVADFMWSQESHRVGRRAKLPVYLVTDEAIIERLAAPGTWRRRRPAV
jgi:nucleotide-binding universal stress UspA family protein